jgi:hypothetical protein
MKGSDMIDDVLDALVERGIAIKPSQARAIRDDVFAACIERGMKRVSA